MRRFWVGCVVGAVVLLAGCGPNGPKATKVSGTVLLDGKPMPDGEIMFSLPGMAPSVLPIKGGSFSGTASEGKDRVEIRTFKAGPPSSTDPTGAPTKANYLPDRFNAQSTLTADVAAGGASDLKFDVTSH